MSTSKGRPRGRIIIDIEKCKGCVLCVGVCPHNVIKQTQSVNAKGYNYVYDANPEPCTACANCALVCPDTVITVYQYIYEEK